MAPAPSLKKCKNLGSRFSKKGKIHGTLAIFSGICYYIRTKYRDLSPVEIHFAVEEETVMLQMEMLWNARGVLSGVINKTPLIPAGTVGNGGSLYLKAECLQKTGAFKLRGAYYKIATLSEEEKRRGA